ncbi:RpiB/LacA/LacB family sugar-phosphate isomerase [Lacrimispora sp. 210928-DFI.3.58]|uniref:RpiB/LacA/LacB family sugar-phosphate isomerase n=1 Tax=Lacrimispora sp. 210928-DFI.3.58 TaxID=2883214 RepID=UPI0015B69C21|nr:RpiB/LacA/LacB family sugar-phosphate isomerase [Lacrimispora sp. 210928-DFI.3.58]MCB7317279.1 RpiB/LacA/LacB family sugar-phosphate isomerase [Lacrimispora sp. 210928-DFI.3.58]
MKVAIGGQGSAFLLKEKVKEYLLEKGYEVCDMGQTEQEDSQFFFVDTVEGVAGKIKSGECERGIVMCGSGAGVSLVANKIKGIYCVPCESIFTAERIHAFNQVNMMAMGAMVVTPGKACEMAEAFLKSTCNGGALEHIKKVEEAYFK